MRLYTTCHGWEEFYFINWFTAAHFSTACCTCLYVNVPLRRFCVCCVCVLCMYVVSRTCAAQDGVVYICIYIYICIYYIYMYIYIYTYTNIYIYMYYIYIYIYIYIYMYSMRVLNISGPTVIYRTTNITKTSFHFSAAGAPRTRPSTICGQFMTSRTMT